MYRVRMNNPSICLRDLFTKQRKDLPDWVDWVDCIYEIRNLINNKVYIGKSTWFFRRFCMLGNFSHITSYIDQCKYGGNVYLYNAIKKYGSRNFEVTIIDELSSDDLTLSDLEIYWIDYYHSYINDPLCQGYNMTRGGESGDQLHSDYANKRRLDALKTRNKELYGENANAASHILTKESREKAYQTNLLIGKGDPYYMIHTEEIQKSSQLRMRRFNEFTNIESHIQKLIDNNLEVTPRNYYRLIYESSTYNDADRHINVICTEIYKSPSITEDPRWTPTIDMLFRYFDSFEDIEDLHAKFNIVTMHGGIVKLRDKFFNTVKSLTSDECNVDKLKELLSITTIDRLRSYLKDPLYIINDSRWKVEYFKLFYRI